MIPRYQRILFWSLVGGISLLALFLIHGCRQAHLRLTELNSAMPIAAPNAATTEDVTFYLASDADGTITPSRAQVALPKNPTLRARVLLNDLLAQYSQPDSPHPLQSGPAIDDVFLLTNPSTPNTGETAILNLHGSFVANHPSGVEVETLTLNSIIGTLHAALPQIAHVRFLVDGQPHDTLAGHADLSRSYPCIDTTTQSTAPTEEATQP
ncbi:GerMN domain-containing protein [Edaphobacter bradus]|uniref:GerMN domain-containing protein n=1 Tax=Edaphobacter bradus TaxID=2259016 RepID=UPI0021DFB0D4|nr:GerMN domain-containing protein [Edaphobacter bradus]